MATVFAGAAWAQSIAGAPPAAAPFKVGALKAWSLRDGQGAFPNNGKTFALGIDPAEVGKVLAAAGAPSDQVTVAVDALLVEAPGRVMLFDTGLGPKFHGALIPSLALAGVEPDAVTDIFITHGHGDHIGGLLDESRAPAFPKAIVHISAPEWAWLKAQPGAATLVAAISSQVRPFEPEAEVASGITSISIPGHTPGHSGYRIASHGQVLVDIGDTAHSSIVSLARPDWKIEFDTDQDEGVTSRRAELARLAAAHARVFAPHFPYPGVGSVTATAGGYRWTAESLAP